MLVAGGAWNVLAIVEIDDSDGNADDGALYEIADVHDEGMYSLEPIFSCLPLIL